MSKKIDVYLDLEGVGVMGPEFGSGARLNLLLKTIPIFFGELGYVIRKVWGTACVIRKNGRLPGEYQIVITRILVSNGGTMVWAESVADHFLILEVEKDLASGELASAMLLVANDHDFRELLLKVKDTGREVVVLGRQVSEKLAKVADKTFSVIEVLGEDSEIPPSEAPLIFNGIDIPINPRI